MRPQGENACEPEVEDGLSPLLEAPLEIRIEIYKYLVERRYTQVGWTMIHASHVFDPAILRVNRQIYVEARPELYRNIRFRAYFHSSWAGAGGETFIPVETFAAHICCIPFDRITNLSLEFFGRVGTVPRHLLRNVLLQLPNLTKVSLFMWRLSTDHRPPGESFYHVLESALIIIDDIRALRTAERVIKVASPTHLSDNGKLALSNRGFEVTSPNVWKLTLPQQTVWPMLS